jgi:hypothetical protein
VASCKVAFATHLPHCLRSFSTLYHSTETPCVYTGRQGDYCPYCAEAGECDNTCGFPCLNSDGPPAATGGGSNPSDEPACDTDAVPICEASISSEMSSCEVLIRRAAWTVRLRL